MMWQAEQGLKLGIQIKMFETELGHKYKQFEIQVVKKCSFLCMMFLCLRDKRIHLHLGASECLIYHSALMKPKSQSELD
jgi:hypothetical protein